MIRKKIEIFADRALEYTLYGMIFYIPISNALIESLFVFALLFFVIKKMAKPEFKFLENYTYLFLMFFLYFSIASFINSGIYFEKSVKALFFKWLEYILMFIVVHDTFLNKPKRLWIAILIFLSVSGLIAIDGIFQQLTKIDFIRHRSWFYVTASFKNPNDFGAYLVAIGLMVIALLFYGTGKYKTLSHTTETSQRRVLESRQRRDEVSCSSLKKQYRYKKIAFGDNFGAIFSGWKTLSLLAVLLNICLILTFSRGAWIGFLAGLFLLIFFSKKKKIFYVLVCNIMSFILIPALRSRVLNTFQPGGDAFRFTIWPVAISMIKENPFLGKGVGTFMAYFSKYPTDLSPQYAHNCFLQIWAETGIFSLISFLLFAGLLLYQGIKKFRKDNDPVLLGLVCGAFGFLVHSFFDTNLYSLQLATLFWVLMGLISAKVSSNSRVLDNS